MTATLLSIGHGYAGRALARALPAGWQCLGSSRQPGQAELLWPDDAPRALQQATHLVSWVAPGAEGDPVLPVIAGLPTPNLRWVGYASASSVYGDTAGAWIDETAAPAPTTERGRRRLAAETAWQDWADARAVPLARLRIAGIYGPGRSVLDALRESRAQRVIKPGQVFNRIHVDDLARLTAAAAAARLDGPLILADDAPTPQAEVTAFAATLLGLPIPPEIDFDRADLGPVARSFYAENKRLRSSRRTELALSLIYPDYRAGLRAILAAGG